LTYEDEYGSEFSGVLPHETCMVDVEPYVAFIASVEEDRAAISWNISSELRGDRGRDGFALSHL